MRATTLWPSWRSRRLDEQMAARPDLSPDPSEEPQEQLSRETIAIALMSQRTGLVRQLPRQIKLARRLNLDQQEWVIDASVDYLVTGNEGGVIKDHNALERAFWKV